jgi:FkbM family methyltransferase
MTSTSGDPCFSSLAIESEPVAASAALAFLIEVKRAAVQLVRNLRRLLADRRYRATYLEKRRLLSLPRDRPATSEVLGPPVAFADPLSFLSAYEEIFVDEDYRFVADRPDPVILDCGANVGLSVLYFKRLYPDARITAFEPDPHLFALLSRNVEAARLQNVSLEAKAVWTQAGSLEFWMHGGLSGRLAGGASGEGIVKVDTIRLRDRLDGPIDLLKMDIEGAEVDVLADCADRLTVVRSLVLEYHSAISGPQRLAELLEILRGAGFRYHVKESWVAAAPLVRREPMQGMDLQLNVYGFRDGRLTPI